MVEGPVLWNHRSIQILVLLSLGLQFILFAFASIRRRESSPVWRLLLWLAYLTADSTAIYAVGHLSLSGAASDHQLVAFWAPFLLLHLGGPDNITAYALQDNQLWLRHFQTLVVQVLGAAYVLYKNITVGGGELLLPLAAILMFVTGFIKYLERTCALRCGNLGNIGGSIKKQPPAMHNHFHPQDEAPEEEFHVRRAHSLFHVCKRAIVDSSVIEKDSESHDTSKMLDGVELWTLMEMELSLMYDILYTKASVIHTWPGYCIRAISPLTVAASLALFQFSGKDGLSRHSTLDVGITYVLLGGALLMETASLLNALGSSWTYAFLSTTRWRWLRYAALCNERWDRLRRAVVSLHHHVKLGRGSSYISRRWSNTLGQYNMLHFCTRRDTLTSPLLGRLAKLVRLKGWWDRKHYSETIKMSSHTKDHISIHMNRLYRKGRLDALGMLRKKWGEEPLVHEGLYDGMLKESLGVEFQEGVIIWHIGTDVYLARSKQVKADANTSDRVDSIRMLSNYMMFLLVERPYMLPGLAQNRLYQRTCANLADIRIRSTPRHHNRSCFAKLQNLFRLNDGPGSTFRAADREQLANNLYDEYADRKFSHDAPRLTYVAGLARSLLEKEEDGIDSLKLVLDVWIDILIYAGNKCSRKSHAMKLNSGGELTTIIWLMAEHLYQVSLEEASSAPEDPHNYSV